MTFFPDIQCKAAIQSIASVSGTKRTDFLFFWLKAIDIEEKDELKIEYRIQESGDRMKNKEDHRYVIDSFG